MISLLFIFKYSIRQNDLSFEYLVIPCMIFCQLIKKGENMPRGGKRKGAGRKKSEPTKRLSVPESLVPEVEEIIKNHKEGKEKPIPKEIESFIELLPEYQTDFENLASIALLFEDWQLIKKIPRNHRKIVIKVLQKS